jgi:hypothetical protein
LLPPGVRPPGYQLHLEFAGEFLSFDLFDGRQGRHPAQFPLQAGDPFLQGADLFGLELLGGDAQRPQHGRDVKVDEQGALVKEGAAQFRPAGAGDLAAADLDVVARPVGRRYPQALQGAGDGAESWA